MLLYGQASEVTTYFYTVLYIGNREVGSGGPSRTAGAYRVSRRFHY